MNDSIHHHRRLTNFDYSSPGAYFSNPLSKILVEDAWKRLPYHFPTVRLDCFAVLPDHVHLLLWLEQPTEEKAGPTLSTVISMFKADVTRAWSRRIKQGNEKMIGTIWQTRFQDRIVRTERELEAKRCYILENEKRHKLKREERG